jgi:hypothetical protein
MRALENNILSRFQAIVRGSKERTQYETKDKKNNYHIQKIT